MGQLLSLARKRYVEPVERTKLMRDAMRGITGGLDRHTNYFDPEQYERLQIRLRGKTVGIGVSLRDRKGVVTVGKTYKGPARRSGMRKGDRVISVDGKPVETVVQAARLLGGEPGTKVKLQVERQGKTLEMQLDRQPVDFNPVRSRLTKDGIGYVRLGHFDQGSADKVRNALSRLERRNHGPLRGLVLDLRNNPGGSVREANSLLNTFISKGTLVSTRGRGGKVDKIHEADPAKTSHGALPLAVLINKRSASASELVSGALRHHRGATLIGEKSYGKGTVQSVVPLVDGSGVKMTTARYYLPDGVTPDKRGITPDFTTDQAKQRFRSANPGSKRRIVDYNFEQALSVLRSKPAPAAGLPVVHKAQLPAVIAP
jgi:carboxyl-terminal processing protease